MSDKKMQILQRLESGEITADEALAMISQINDTHTPPHESKHVDPSPADPRQINPNTHQHHQSHDQENYGDYEHHAPDWVNNLVGWVGDVVEEITDSVRDADVSVNISDFFSGEYGHYKRTENFTSKPVLQGLAKLELNGKNDIVEIYAYDGDCVQIRCEYDARRADNYVHFLDDNGNVALWFDDKTMRSVRVMCYVPRVHIGHIHATTKNSRIQVADIIADEINLTTKNDKIVIESVNCNSLTAITKNDNIKAIAVSGDNISLETTNAKIMAENIHAGLLNLKTTNASIKTSDVDAVHLMMNTTNSSLKMENTLMNASAFWENERTLEAYTTNGNIKLGIPGGIGFNLEANTTDGKIKCDIPLYRTEGSHKTYLVGESTDYATTGRRLSMRLGTTNASVKIQAV
ncbi:MAG: DUF4097 family beta strand repeat-containing protein [Defluviitaleaceae bacterium]|nr:DUF4097 family beta strand repeat-containing protein [Defluviitaleaceae bacterium]